MPEATTRAPDPGLTAFLKGMMMKRRLLVLLVFCFFGLAGCTTIGPFVTDVYYDSDGNLVVTKNVIKHDSFNGTISVGDNPQTIVNKRTK